MYNYSLSPVARGRHKLGSSNPCGPAMASISSQATWSPITTMTTAVNRNPYNSHIRVNVNVRAMVYNELNIDLLIFTKFVFTP